MRSYPILRVKSHQCCFNKLNNEVDWVPRMRGVGVRVGVGLMMVTSELKIFAAGVGVGLRNIFWIIPTLFVPTVKIGRAHV